MASKGVAIADVPRVLVVFDDEVKAEELAGLAMDARTCAERHDEVLAWLIQRVDALEIELRKMRATVQQWEGD